MPRCTINSSPPSSPSSRNFPRRSTLTTLWPTSTVRKTSPGGVRTTSSRSRSTASKRRPSTAPRRSRATVSTSGSSGTWNRRHLSPVVADFDVNFEGYAQLRCGAHVLTQQRNQRRHLTLGCLQEELVVHLQQHARAQTGLANGVVDQDHRLLHDVRGRALQRHVDGHALRRL